MSITSFQTGTLTTTGGEDTLHTATDDDVYMLIADLNDMVGAAAPDEVEIAVYQIVASTGTYRLVKKYSLKGVQAETCFRTPPYPSVAGIRFTIKAVVGTVTIPWELFKLQ